MAILDKKERLWIEYSHSKSTAVREELIMEYVSLVKLVAGRLAIYLGANVEYDDLVSYGIFGLIDAIDKFDYGLDSTFGSPETKINHGGVQEARSIERTELF